MDNDGNGDGMGVVEFVTRLEWNEYKEHQETKHENLCNEIKSQGKAHRLAVWYVGGLVTILTFFDIVLRYLGVI